MLTIREQLNTTRSRLLSALDGLNDDQLNWRPDDFTWSIAQGVQHIAMVESASSKTVSLGLSQEPNFVPTAMPLDQLILDRSKKVNAPERLHPPTDWKTKNELEQILHNSQEKFLDALARVEDVTLLDKTAPPMPHPVFGQMSTRQWIASVPLHEERHIQQIEVLKQRL